MMIKNVMLWVVVMVIVMVVFGLPIMMVWHDLHRASYDAWWMPFIVAIPTCWFHAQLMRWLRRGGE